MPIPSSLSHLYLDVNKSRACSEVVLDRCMSNTCVMVGILREVEDLKTAGSFKVSNAAAIVKFPREPR